MYEKCGDPICLDKLYTYIHSLTYMLITTISLREAIRIVMPVTLNVIYGCVYIISLSANDAEMNIWTNYIWISISFSRASNIRINRFLQGNTTSRLSTYTLVIAHISFLDFVYHQNVYILDSVSRNYPKPINSIMYILWDIPFWATGLWNELYSFYVGRYLDHVNEWLVTLKINAGSPYWI